MSFRQTAGGWIGRGLVAGRVHRRMLGERGIVVAFHRINDTIPEDGLTRSSRVFDRFCQSFRENFDVLPLSEFVSRLERKESVAGALAITFDDGYRCNFEIAAPILKRLGLPATFFVVSKYIGSTAVPWWDQSITKHPGWMTWDEVRTLRAEGFEIGPHSRTHLDLGKVDGEVADTEIAGSRADLEKELGEKVDLFAYPYGQRANLSEANRARVKAAGYRCCASCHGPLAPTGTDPFRLPRMPITPWIQTPDQFAFEVIRLRDARPDNPPSSPTP